MIIAYSQRQSENKDTANITAFDGIININSFDGLKEVAQHDHVLAEIGEGTQKTTGQVERYHRADDCFIRADVIGMDVDNSHSDNSADWVTPEQLSEKLPGVKFAIIYSLNNMKEKDGKAARPKFHCYFFLSCEFNEAEKVKALKVRLMNYLPNIFDTKCKEATRLFFGVANPNGKFFDGDKRIDTFLNEAKAETAKTSKAVRKFKELDGVIPVGERDNTLFNYALHYLMRYTPETARKKYDAKAATCAEPLESYQIEKCFRSAQNSDKVRARYLASEKIKEHDDDFQSAYYEYEDEVQSITTDGKIAVDAWRTAVELVQKNIKEPRASTYRKKIPLTSRHVEQFLKENNITARVNVITQEYEVIGLPEDSEYTPEFYAGLHEADKKNLGALILIDFLTPALKDRNYTFADKNLKSIVSNIFLAHEYNPVAEMMKNAEWDKRDRISELCKILGIESNPLYCTYLKKWLIQGAAMAFNDKGRPYGNEFVLVLQGAQGIGKTSFFEVLALKPEWFNSGVIVDVFNKDSLIQLDNAFINEIGEYDQTQSKEQSALRDVITRPISKYRLPYAEKHIDRIRRCCFGATVNADRFIMNADGGTRRDAVIKLTKDFHNEIRELTDDWVVQLWAQAYSLFCVNDRGFRLTYEERQAQEKLNADVTVLLPGEQELWEWLNWDTPIENWTLTSASQFIKLTGVKFSARTIGKALARLVQKDNRIKVKRDRLRGNLYLLPPVMQLEQVFAYGNAEIAEVPEIKSDMNTEATVDNNEAEIIKGHDVLLNLHKKDKCRISFKQFVECFDRQVLAELIGKKEMEYEESAKIKEAIIAYHEKRVAA